jgi:hypothetical protein
MTVRTSYGRFHAARPDVPNLPEPYQTLLHDVFAVWSQKLSRNYLRARYYDQKNSLKDIGISIPPPLANNKEFQAVIEWAATAVDSLAVRSRFDGFVGEGAEEANAVFELSHMKTKYDMLVTSELTNACSFASVTRGINSPARISLYSALNAAALWDYELDRVKCGLTVTNVDKQNRPTGYNLFTDDAIVVLTCDDKRRWSYEIYPQPMGQPLFVAFVNQPSLDRPFGKSRITRAIMSIVDEAVRESVRGSVASEFAVAPQKYILGAPDDLLDDIPEWQAYIGNILALNRDENNEIPTVGQFPQGDMQQHILQMRQLAARMSGASSVPISSLGIIHDNPDSAEAMRTAERNLIISATKLNTSNGDSLKLLGQMAVAVANNEPLSALTPEQMDITPKFLSPAYPDPLSQGDATLKLVQSFPWMSESQVSLELMGLDEATIRRLMSDKRRVDAANAIESLNAAYVGGGNDGEQESI